MAEQAFVVYQLIVQAVGGKSKQVPLSNFTHDLDAIAEAVSPQTRMVFLANPNNPTGTIFRRDEWDRFLDKVSAEVLLIVDEAYFEYVQDPGYPDSLKYHADGRAILTLRTFSKLYGLAGLRIGYGVAPKELISMMQRVRQPFNVNAAAQWAALAALDDVDHVRRSLEVNRQGLDYLQSEFAKLGLAHVPSHGNFILVRVGKGQEIFQQLITQGVIVRPMGAYKFPEYVRVTVGTMEENRKFIDALERVIKNF
jgi:histidinol-phosphate aminotransferase